MLHGMLSRSMYSMCRMSAEEIYKECDYITIHVPLMDSTKKHDQQRSHRVPMKENVVVLNFSRDTLVDEAAMVEALRRQERFANMWLDFPNPTTAGVEGTVS